MDLNSLKDQVSNLTLYDLKAGVRKVQNGKLALFRDSPSKLTRANVAVMNYTEMEAKVHMKPHPHSYPWRLKGMPGSRSNEQRTMGGLIECHAGNRQWHP